MTADPWDRMHGETLISYAAFQQFRDMGPRRTIAALSRRPDAVSALQQMRRWSCANDWFVRAAAWDAEVDRQVRLAQVEEIKAMRQRHIEIGMAAQNKGLARLASIPLERLTARDAISLIDLGVKIERLGRGEEQIERVHEEQTVAPLGPHEDMTGASILTMLREHPELAEFADRVRSELLERLDDTPPEE
jgi:hypothetical protein